MTMEQSSMLPAALCDISGGASTLWYSCPQGQGHGVMSPGVIFSVRIQLVVLLSISIKLYDEKQTPSCQPSLILPFISLGSQPPPGAPFP